LDGPAVSPRLPGRVRIVGGSRRGHRVGVATGSRVRPTSERVREAIFDVLGPVAGLRVLDLFAGTGAMGLEALSRGAANCIFVERDRAIANMLQGNIRHLRLEAESRVVVAPYLSAVRSLLHAGGRVDLLFVDPPYRMLAEVEVMLTPLLPQVLSTDGVVIVEGDRSGDPRFGQAPVFERIYGDTKVTMVKLGGAPREDGALPGHV
jgi:16S rRNA (guanine966-N2)-methyltransferase